MPTDRPALPSLLDRLGGPGALWTAVEAAVARASADPELSEHAIEIVTGAGLDEHVASPSSSSWAIAGPRISARRSRRRTRNGSPPTSPMLSR